MRTERGDVFARKLLVCMDGYSDGSDPWFRRRLVPVRSRIIATEPLGKDAMERLMPARMMHGDMRKLSYYYRPSPDGSQIYFGGRDDTTEGYPIAPTIHQQAELASLFPKLSGVRLTHSWFGYVAMHCDMVPCIFSSGNKVCATGFCGSGIVWARRLGNKPALKVLGDAEQASGAFDFDPAPKVIPVYNGRPWLIPILYSMYERNDKKTLRQRNQI